KPGAGPVGGLLDRGRRNREAAPVAAPVEQVLVGEAGGDRGGETRKRERRERGPRRDLAPAAAGPVREQPRPLVPAALQERPFRLRRPAGETGAAAHAGEGGRRERVGD